VRIGLRRLHQLAPHLELEVVEAGNGVDGLLDAHGHEAAGRGGGGMGRRLEDLIVGEI
jgi:hypothetical protein